MDTGTRNTLGQLLGATVPAEPYLPKAATAVASAL
jgi:hypothetical protein